MSGEKHHVRAHRRQSGLSLIELMISLALAALFLLGIVVLFQQSKSSALQDEQIARMQENGRYALRVLSRELAMMNYFGGMIDVDTSEPLQFESKLDNKNGCNADWLLEIDTPLEFSDKDDSTDNVDDPDYTCINENTEIVDGTDVLAIKRVGDYAAREYDADGDVTGTLETGTAYFFTNGSQGALYNADGSSDDCDDCEFVTVTPASSNIRQYQPQIFYIRPYSIEDDGIPSLVRETLVGDEMQAQVLVEGIEDLQIEWGMDCNDLDLTPDYYTADPDPFDPGSVNCNTLDKAMTARIFLLVRSLDQVTGYVNDKTYNLGGKVIEPNNDAFYRRVYSTTVQLRNSEKLQMSSSD